MEYILDFSVISFLFLCVTAVFYLQQRKVRNQRYKLYGWLIVLCLATLILDVAAAALDPVAYRLPRWLYYAVNILFLICTQLSGPVFLLYTMVLTGRYSRCGKTVRTLLWFPFAMSFVGLMCSPFTTFGIFTLDAANVYVHGPTYMVLYAAMGFYLITSAVLVFLSMRRIQRRKRTAIYVFLALTLAAMFVQVLNPRLLVNSMANALALTIIYHALEAPSENIDPLTRLFGRAALTPLLYDCFEQNQSFSLTVLPLNDFNLINHALGIRRGDMIMIAFSRYLEQAFPGREVLRLAGDIYAVLEIGRERPLTADSLEDTLQSIPDNWKADGMVTELSVRAVGINSGDYTGAAQVLDAVALIVEQHESGRQKQRITLADKAFIRESQLHEEYEAALDRAIAEERVQVYYQPIHDSNGRLAALEALCRITDPDMGPLRPDIFIPIAENNGSIYKLGDMVLNEVCAFVKRSGADGWGLHHIGVNLSLLQCMQPGLADSAARIVEKYGIAPSILGFEITETEGSSSLAAVRENMLALTKRGFSFLLDDFGSGYANFNYIADLPFQCIKIDRDILWTAESNPKQMAFLRGISTVARRLGLSSLCEGVETEAQARLLADMGVDMQQGFYYSKALPEAQLIEYAAKARGEAHP